MSDWQGNIAAFMKSECDAILGPYGDEYTQEPVVVYAVAIARIEALTAQLAQRDAALEAADDLAVMLQECLEAPTKEDGRLCCDGRECGCYGATKHQQAEHYANKALTAYRKARGQDA